MTIININLNIIVIRAKQLKDYEGVMRMTIYKELSMDQEDLVEVFGFVRWRDYLFWMYQDECTKYQ